MLAGSPMEFKDDTPDTPTGGLPATPSSEGLYALVNQVTIVDGQPTEQIFWQKTESC